MGVSFSVIDDHDLALQRRLLGQESRIRAFPRLERSSGSLAALALVPRVFSGARIWRLSRLDDGIWELRVSATDFVLNESSARFQAALRSSTIYNRPGRRWASADETRAGRSCRRNDDSGLRDRFLDLQSKLRG